jgi:type II secretory pathway pseudopilin PulG
MSNQKGFTVLELTLSAAFFVVLMGAAVTAMITDTRAAQMLNAAVGPEMRSRHALDRIVSDLRMASLLGEDLNGNGYLDKGEDLNENGVLDSNWNLADGVVDQENLVFNRRIDLKDVDGNLVAVGIFSRKVAYFVKEERLIRMWEATDFNTGKTIKHVDVLSERVAAIRFSRKGTVVRINIDYLIRGHDGEIHKGTRGTAVVLRN